MVRLVNFVLWRFVTPPTPKHMPIQMREISQGDAMIGYTPFGAYRAFLEPDDSWTVHFDGAITRWGKGLPKDGVEHHVNRDYNRRMARAYR